MSTFVNNDVSSGATVYASDHNTQGALLAAVINGGIDNNNISASAAIAGSKLADSSVPAGKIDFGGSGTGIWWQEIGRTTLGTAGDTLTVASLPARKHIRVYLNLLPTGGTINGSIRFNSDATASYSGRGSTNGGADATGTSATSIGLTGTGAFRHHVILEAVNISNQEKVFWAWTGTDGTAGAGNLPERVETLGKWVNTSAQISTITITNGGTGDYAVGTEIVVLGHD